VSEKNEINPMQLAMHLAPRCKARSKRSGKPCRSPAVTGFNVCRMHGAGGGAPIANRNALKHGEFTRKAIAMRREIAELIRNARRLVMTIS
jgi:uncharacterized protein YjcR